MHAIGAEQDAVAQRDRCLVDMNGWRKRTTQRLGNATPQAKIAEFEVGQIFRAHGLVDMQGIFLRHHLVLNQPAEQSIVDRQPFERLTFAQVIDAAIAYMPKDHGVIVL